MPELDSLRGVAILSVVLYHGLFWTNNLEGLSGRARIVVSLTRFGWLGVNLFFVLSGFLITGILLNRKHSSDYYSYFYFRRAVRILPALYALLLVLCLVPGEDYRYLALSFFFCANLAAFFHVPYPYAVLWSLGVEEQFYLLWPSAVRRLGQRFLYVCIGVLVISAPVFRALAFRRPLPEGFGSVTWQTWDGIAMGTLLALLSRESGMNRRRLALIGVLSVACALLALGAGAPFGMWTRTERLGASMMLSVVNLLFFGVLAVFLWCGSGAHARFVQWRILRFYGDISYGLYLYHLLVFMGVDWALSRLLPDAKARLGTAGWLFSRLAVVFVLATLLAYVSRWYFEERFLRWKLKPKIVGEVLE